MGNRTRQFSLTRPIMYQGKYYPSAEADISYGNGVENNGRIFVDANGNYFTLDSYGNALEAMVEQNLPETVVLPDKEDLLSKQFNDYITSSNDNTQVSNVPHRQYNTNLTENALRGARYNAEWEKAHPNATAWRNATEAIPFAVAAAPFVLGAGEAALGTAAGQAIGNGLGMAAKAASNSSFLPWADAAI